MIEDLAQATKAQVDRAMNGAGTTSLRRATVTSASPFTISMNGVSIVSPPHSQHYYPIVGDTVMVLMDGAAAYVLEQLGSPWHAITNIATQVVNPAGSTLGNQQFDGVQYKVADLECTFEGRVLIGSTTVWAVGGVVIWLPILMATIHPSNTPSGFVFAYDNSASQMHTGFAHASTGAAGGCFIRSTTVVNSGNTTDWAAAAAPNATPFNSGAAWAVNDEVRFQLHYKVDPIT